MPQFSLWRACRRECPHTRRYVIRRIYLVAIVLICVLVTVAVPRAGGAQALGIVSTGHSGPGANPAVAGQQQPDPAPAAPAGPIPPGWRFKTFTGSDFGPLNSFAQYSVYVNQRYLLTVDPYEEDFVAHVDLPDGAGIQEVVFWYLDNDDGANRYLSFWLLSYTPSTGGSMDLASLSTSTVAASATIRPAFVTSPLGIVDNVNMAYQLQARIQPGGSSNLRLVGARVAYTLYNTDLPYVSKQ